MSEPRDPNDPKVVEDIGKKVAAELKRRDREQRRKARIKILGFLEGTIAAALNEDPNHSWILKDRVGDKLKTVEEKQAARIEAHRVMRNLQEERDLLEDM